MIKRLYTSLKLIAFVFILLNMLASCKHKKKMQKTENLATVNTPEDSSTIKCKLDYKTAKALARYVKENEFAFNWISAKANVESVIDEKEENFDIKLSVRKDSAILVSVRYLLGIEVAKVFITKDTVIFVNYINRNYFKGDFNNINSMLNADLDYDMLQAVLFGNSAEYSDDEAKLKPVADRQNCHYLLSTERKRKLRRIQAGAEELKSALQTLTLNPDNFKILKNEFIDPVTNRRFIANYSDFKLKDSVYAPYHVDIDIVAQKKASLKIEYVRMEKNVPQKLSINIPSKYDQIHIQQKK
jgi:hypothetical protein